MHVDKIWTFLDHRFWHFEFGTVFVSPCYEIIMRDEEEMRVLLLTQMGSCRYMMRLPALSPKSCGSNVTHWVSFESLKNFFTGFNSSRPDFWTENKNFCFPIYFHLGTSTVNTEQNTISNFKMIRQIQTDITVPARNGGTGTSIYFIIGRSIFVSIKRCFCLHWNKMLYKHLNCN